jgi:hypothetical protein
VSKYAKKDKIEATANNETHRGFGARRLLEAILENSHTNLPFSRLQENLVCGGLL